ncbi:YkgJ family cysteine cluster protein [Lachnospiraceae bacterium 42-17]|jgi:Fe-S-cluster containining protein|nr:YkgJ family cysteine cluster protein [Dorea sp.]
MDTRMKEILNAFKNNKLTPDSSFRFHCTQCGKCCINRDDIILSPLDLFRIAKELNLSMEEVLKQYCEWYIGIESRFPTVSLKPRGSIRRCPFLKNHRCMVQKAKPAVCAMFPIGRAALFDTENKDDSQGPAVEYFYTNPGCGDNAKTQTVREWFDLFNIPIKDEFFVAWSTFQMKLIGLLAEAEGTFGKTVMPQLWSPIFGILYLCYNPEEEFYPQFQENTEKLLEGLQMILDRKVG